MLIAQCNSYRINTISVYQRVSCWARNHPEKEFLSVFMSPLKTTLMNELMFCPALVVVGTRRRKKQSSCLWVGLRKFKFKIQIIYSTLTLSHLMCKHRDAHHQSDMMAARSSTNIISLNFTVLCSEPERFKSSLLPLISSPRVI